MSGESRPLTVHCEGPFIAALQAGRTFDLSDHQAHAWFARLDELRHRLPSYSTLLDEAELARAARFRFQADRERFILGHGMLRDLLGNYLEHDPAALDIQRGTFGKPFVEGTRLRFNLSDTKDALLIALTLDEEIGADIETMGRTVDHMAVGEHYFTPEEIATMTNAANGKKRFLELWTRKEAVLKASGVGIMDDLRVLRVDAAENRMLISHEAFMAHAADSYRVVTWHVAEEHIISLATGGRPLATELRAWT